MLNWAARVNWKTLKPNVLYTGFKGLARLIENITRPKTNDTQLGLR